MTRRGAGAQHGHGDTTMPSLLALDDPASTDPRVTGGKAAWLSRGLAAALPVLPGIVVTTAASLPHMQLGIGALARRGSGGARLEVSMTGLADDFAAEIATRSAALGDVLVVRSSSILEAGAEWAGAFTSYLAVQSHEVARAVTGCWASAFTVGTLERHEAAGIAPGSAGMAVLIQRFLSPSFGGTASLDGDDVVLTAVAGSPAPLVQGWEPGVRGRVAANGQISGEAVGGLMGETLIRRVTEVVRRADCTVGANSCEWAVVGNEVILLQLMRTRPRTAAAEPIAGDRLAVESASHIARLARRYPGPLGETLVLPWAVGNPMGLLTEVAAADLSPAEALATAMKHAPALTAEVWSLPKRAAAAAAARALRMLRGPDPGATFKALAGLATPDPERAHLVLAALATVRNGLVAAGAVTWPEVGWHLDPAEVGRILGGRRPATRRHRVGFDRWEPFAAAVVAAHGTRAHGSGAAPGIACGRLRWISGPTGMSRFRPRDVIVAPLPTQHLAALLWDAAAVVTTGGGPAAHLFESARALAIPAVAAIHLDDALGADPAESDGLFALTVDGNSGSVFVTEW